MYNIFTFLQEMKDPIVFSALKTHGTYYSGSYLTSYSKFLTNYGDGFNLQTGVFTAPRSGVYNFSASTYFGTNDDQDTHEISVEKNNRKEMEFQSWIAHTNKWSIENDQDTLTFDFILVLQKSDTVRLRVNDGKFQCSDWYACIFSGHFVREI